MSFKDKLHPLIRRKRNNKYNDTNYAVINAFDTVLDEMEKETLESKAQSAIHTATGWFLDNGWGSWFGVKRHEGEADEEFRKRIIYKVQIPRGTVEAVKYGIREYLDNEYVGIKIYEPWENIFYLNDSKLNSDAHLIGAYYNYGVMDITIGSSFPKDMLKVIDLFKPAGVTVHVRVDTSLPSIDPNSDKDLLPTHTINVHNNYKEYVRTLGMSEGIMGKFSIFDKEDAVEGEDFVLINDDEKFTPQPITLKDDFYLNTKLVVSNPKDEFYYQFPNPPLGAVFNQYNQNIGEVIRGDIDFSAVAGSGLAIIKLYEKTRNPIYLDRVKLIAEYALSTSFTAKFRGVDMYLIPSRVQYKNGSWVKLSAEIGLRTMYLAIGFFTGMYRITGEQKYKDSATLALKTVGTAYNNTIERVANKELQPFMEGAIYETLYLNTEFADPSAIISFSWRIFSQNSADVMASGLNKYIETFGNNSLTDYTETSFTPQSIKDGYIEHFKAVYSNGMATMTPTGLPYTFIRDEVATNWDWVDTFQYGDTWFAGDSIMWIIKGLAELGKEDATIKGIANTYRDRLLLLQSKEHPTYTEDKNELLFFDRYNFYGTHLPDDTALSISSTALFWDIDELLGVNDTNLVDKIKHTLSVHRITGNKDLNKNGSYAWDPSDSTSIVETKAISEVLVSPYLDVIIGEAGYNNEPANLSDYSLFNNRTDLIRGNTATLNGFEHGVGIGTDFNPNPNFRLQDLDEYADIKEPYDLTFPNNNLGYIYTVFDLSHFYTNHKDKIIENDRYSYVDYLDNNNVTILLSGDRGRSFAVEYYNFLSKAWETFDTGMFKENKFVVSSKIAMLKALNDNLVVIIRVKTFSKQITIEDMFLEYKYGKKLPLSVTGSNTGHSITISDEKRYNDVLPYG